MSGDSSGQHTNTLDTATRRSLERTGGALLWQQWKMTKPEACVLETIFPITSALLLSRIRHWQTIKNADKISLINEKSFYSVFTYFCPHLRYKIAHIQY